MGGWSFMHGRGAGRGQGRKNGLIFRRIRNYAYFYSRKTKGTS